MTLKWSDRWWKVVSGHEIPEESVDKCQIFLFTDRIFMKIHHNHPARIDQSSESSSFASFSQWIISRMIICFSGDGNLLSICSDVALFLFDSSQINWSESEMIKRMRESSWGSKPQVMSIIRGWASCGGENFHPDNHRGADQQMTWFSWRGSQRGGWRDGGKCRAELPIENQCCEHFLLCYVRAVNYCLFEHNKNRELLLLFFTGKCKYCINCLPKDGRVWSDRALNQSVCMCGLFSPSLAWCWIIIIIMVWRINRRESGPLFFIVFVVFGSSAPWWCRRSSSSSSSPW